MNNKRWILNIVYIILGIVLLICGATGTIDDYWSGMGGGLLGIGIIQLIRIIRLNSNPEYKANYEVELQDERNKFLRTKAWSWAGYWFVIITAIGSIAFKLLGREDLMMFCSMSVCLILVLYWVCYLVLKRKY